MMARFSAEKFAASYCGNAAAYTCARIALTMDTAIIAVVSICVVLLPLFAQ